MAEGKKELVLVNNECAWVKDLSGGMIYVYLGPHKEPLSVDSVIVTQNVNREFVPIGGDTLKGQTFTVALESQYVILHNPEGPGTRPMTRGKNEAVALQTGKSIVKRGPCEFPLWPGQQAEVVDGHRLTSDQFLRIRVEGEIADSDVKWLQDLLKEDWLAPKPTLTSTSAPSAPNTFTLGGLIETSPTPAAPEPAEPVEVKLPELTIGSEWIVRGSKTKFFIPPTGVKVLKATDEVTRSEDDLYVMNGVTLDADEYVILKNRSGRISYVLGSTTVIPCEDQVFQTDRTGINPVFKAQSIDDNSGVLLRTLVPMSRKTIQERMGQDIRIQFTPIAQYDYDEDQCETDGRTPDAEEVLPPGTQIVVWREKRLVFPADGIQIIRRFEATHILAGTARYVKNSITGRTRIVQGECLYLADPRCEEFATRQLSRDLINLWFPGTAADTYNPELVPCITVPQGTASMILKKGTGSSTRKTIIGYSTYFLEWDETLCEMKLSTSRGGEAKTYQNAIRVCYLWMKSNRINDVLAEGRTREDCEFKVQYTLTVDFEEAHKDSWFNVDDYVFLVCEEVRSRLRGGLLATSISDLSTNYVEIIRDVVLGTKPSRNGENVLDKLVERMAPHRPGIEFPRFGGRLVEININSFQIEDPNLQSQLRKLQMAGINESVQTRTAQITLEGATVRAEIEREKSTLSTRVNEFNQAQELLTTTVTEETKRKKAEETKKTALALVEGDKVKSLADLLKNKELSEKQDELLKAQRTTQEAIASLDLKIATLKQDTELTALTVVSKSLEIKRLDEMDRTKGLAESAAIVNASILPTIGAHLSEIRESLVAEKLIQAFGSVANFRGMDVVELATQTLTSLPGLGPVLSRMKARVVTRGEPDPDRNRGR